MRCENCDGEAKYHGYCKKCYSEIWDNGFSSTSDHAYKIGFDELAEDVKGDVDEKFDKAVKEINPEWEVKWYCLKCGAERQPKRCASCGTVGYVKPSRPEKYFN